MKNERPKRGLNKELTHFQNFTEEELDLSNKESHVVDDSPKQDPAPVCPVCYAAGRVYNHDERDCPLLKSTK